ncbi:MAG: hypothetical protein C0190_04845 [Thermodesulfobacterium geofontis]|uniref:Phosphate-starvation-inducible E-like protein n=1 Tax=Thermodesulfobacterium geofontis TaxID=1295609 RepID=A0A2N7PN09_9BACT|nr:MAG: hypothetical protein C0190_04845 [Thermodesulfobacterium geofontis]PMP97820.1 MAG: hypothetical protein C0169_01955 [Thermodesulfobacterium geofontis]
MTPDEKPKFFIFKGKETLINLEEYLYYLVALGLVIGFVLVMIDGLKVLISLIYQTTELTEGAVKFLDKILVSLIFLEIFYTIIVAILDKSVIKCVEPFILVAITALVRRLLIISFETSHLVSFSPERMKFYLIEMALVGILILLLIFGVILFRRSKR